jgi:hypothetical protein
VSNGTRTERRPCRLPFCIPGPIHSTAKTTALFCTVHQRPAPCLANPAAHWSPDRKQGPSAFDFLFSKTSPRLPSPNHRKPPLPHSSHPRQVSPCDRRRRLDHQRSGIDCPLSLVGARLCSDSTVSVLARRAPLRVSFFARLVPAPGLNPFLLTILYLHPSQTLESVHNRIPKTSGCVLSAKLHSIRFSHRSPFLFLTGSIAGQSTRTGGCAQQPASRSVSSILALF